MSAQRELQRLDWCSYLRYLLLRIVLWLSRRSRVSRFAGIFDLLSTDPFRFGAIPHPREFEEEWPYPERRLKAKKLDDRLTVFCTSPSGQILAVKFTRRPDKLASIFLYLRTQKAAYVLPQTKQVNVDLSAEDTFSVDGLKLECVIPFHRWRISFNGLLRSVVCCLASVNGSRTNNFLTRFGRSLRKRIEQIARNRTLELLLILKQ